MKIISKTTLLFLFSFLVLKAQAVDSKINTKTSQVSQSVQNAINVVLNNVKMSTNSYSLKRALQRYVNDMEAILSSEEMKVSVDEELLKKLDQAADKVIYEEYMGALNFLGLKDEKWKVSLDSLNCDSKEKELKYIATFAPQSDFVEKREKGEQIEWGDNEKIYGEIYTVYKAFCDKILSLEKK